MVWVNSSKYRTMEKLDRTLLTSYLDPKNLCQVSGCILNGGCLTISKILKLRRVNFLHYLVNLDQNSMLYKFFLAQWKYPIRNDWTFRVKQDLNDFQMTHNLDFFREKSKEAFKTLTKTKAQNFELNRP